MSRKLNKHLTALARRPALISTLAMALTLAACGDPADNTDATLTSSASESQHNYATYEWTDLLPEQDLQALLNPPEYIFDIEEGAAEDILADPLKAMEPTGNESAYEQALLSTNIRPELDGKDIRIAGYVVPLEFDTDQTVSQFFFVPYFGACIHVPPPPPNQLILVDSDKKISMDDIYQPYWIAGKLQTTLYENDVGTSAYRMTLDHAEVYSEEP